MQYTILPHPPIDTGGNEEKHKHASSLFAAANAFCVHERIHHTIIIILTSISISTSCTIWHRRVRFSGGWRTNCCDLAFVASFQLMACCNHKDCRYGSKWIVVRRAIIYNVGIHSRHTHTHTKHLNNWRKYLSLESVKREKLQTYEFMILFSTSYAVWALCLLQTRERNICECAICQNTTLTSSIWIVPPLASRCCCFSMPSEESECSTNELKDILFVQMETTKMFEAELSGDEKKRWHRSRQPSKIRK